MAWMRKAVNKELEGVKEWPGIETIPVTQYTKKTGVIEVEYI